MLSADINVITSENSWDDIQRSDAHRRVIQGEIISHFRESSAGDPQMERLRQSFMEAYNHFKNEGHAWLKPQELARRLIAVKQADSRNDFERRFIYYNPQRVISYFYFLTKHIFYEHEVDNLIQNIV